METTGTLAVKFDSQTVSEKFKKRDFVVEVTEGNYTQKILFQLTQSKVDLLDNFEEGQTITVKFNLKGKEYNGKYYNTLEAWKIN